MRAKNLRTQKTTLGLRNRKDGESAMDGRLLSMLLSARGLPLVGRALALARHPQAFTSCDKGRSKADPRGFPAMPAEAEAVMMAGEEMRRTQTRATEVTEFWLFWLRRQLVVSGLLYLIAGAPLTSEADLSHL